MKIKWTKCLVFLWLKSIYQNPFEDWEVADWRLDGLQGYQRFPRWRSHPRGDVWACSPHKTLPLGWGRLVPAQPWDKATCLLPLLAWVGLGRNDWTGEYEWKNLAISGLSQSAFKREKDLYRFKKMYGLNKTRVTRDIIRTANKGTRPSKKTLVATPATAMK